MIAIKITSIRAADFRSTVGRLFCAGLLLLMSALFTLSPAFSTVD